jgi:hypothetical protein
MAEELGKGLQNPVHECESRSRLQNTPQKYFEYFEGATFTGRVAELVYAADLKSVADKA